MEADLTIVGATKFKGEIEGTHYDQTKVNVLLSFGSRRKATHQGFNIKSVNYGDSKNFDMFDGRRFPIVAKVDYEPTDTGIEIHDIKLPSGGAPAGTNKG